MLRLIKLSCAAQERVGFDCRHVGIQLAFLNTEERARAEEEDSPLLEVAAVFRFPVASP